MSDRPTGGDPVAHLRADIVFEARLKGRPLTFRSTWGLFSPREVDEGSRLLLDHLEVEDHHDCLDVGCGYGPLGITLAALAPRGRTLLVDKDFVAVDYARRNIHGNGLANAEAVLSNGFGAVGDRCFDVVVSNLPAKVGKELLSILLHDARRHLRPGGRLCVVTVSGLRRFIERNLKDVFGNYDKRKQGAHYTVALATKQD
ncbi:MAG: methyltransferase [Gammaproteobacteria bacterium]|nr:methyltransferase [Gammaproteobacteria bacterium]